MTPDPFYLPLLFAPDRGSAEYAKGDLDGAVADYNRVIELDPNDADAYFNRALAKDGKGDHRGAIADFNRAVELNRKTERH